MDRYCICILLISYISQIVGIMNTRYWIEDNYFILTTGIFNKKRKELNIKRIQSVDMTQGGRQSNDRWRGFTNQNAK